MSKQGLGYTCSTAISDLFSHTGGAAGGSATTLLSCETVVNELLVFLADNSQF